MRANKKKSFRQNLNKTITTSSSEPASGHWMTKRSHSREVCLHRLQEIRQTEAALTWDASVYFLDYFLINTWKAVTSSRSQMVRVDNRALRKRAECTSLHDSRRAWSVGPHRAVLTSRKKSTMQSPQHKLNQENLTQHFWNKEMLKSYHENLIIHQHNFLLQWLLGGWRFPEKPTFLLCLGHAVYPEGKNRQKRLRKLELFFKTYLACLNHERLFHCTDILVVSHKLKVGALITIPDKKSDQRHNLVLHPFQRKMQKSSYRKIQNKLLTDKCS